MAIALKEDRPVRGEESIAERPDGTRVTFIPYPTPLHDSSGALIGAVNMLVDITERKKAEEALQRLADTLEERVAQRTKQCQLIDHQWAGIRNPSHEPTLTAPSKRPQATQPDQVAAPHNAVRLRK